MVRLHKEGLGIRSIDQFLEISASSDYNFTAVKEEMSSESDNEVYKHASPTMRSVHEDGHNAAPEHRHNFPSKGAYGYGESGWQNSTDPVPNRDNTRNVINDSTNRSTLGT